ncbi:AraC-like DNA-binding protein [Crossiella equi]|uniref:AraC-like DNA-binding protein n=1 Tax=Crossiella equi TaxID=130796 RepID=A0ABS5A8D2_9PSEU|nr:helix-turn-helix transcriptional regulator [Crossiella equi]MBP2472848.1 AraC-like DNA-binding protein [Crossiella equi]
MSYTEYAPAPALRAHVRCLWTDLGTTGRPQRVLPDGSLDLLWLDGRLAVAGPDTTWRLAALPAGSAVAGLRFRPGAARLLLGGVPAAELRDRTVPAEDLWALPRLGERVASPAEAARFLEETAVGRLTGFGELDPLVMAVTRALDRPAPPPVPDLAARAGLSERTLRRRLVDAVGYGPKTLERILRFQRVVQAGPGGLARVAAEAGYADQAHLSREFRRLAGYPPSSLPGQPTNA